MRYLVTGGCGFVGSAVVRALAASGARVLNVDRRPKTQPCPQLAPAMRGEGYAQLAADAGDAALMRAVMREFRPHGVIHLAGESSAAPPEKRLAGDSRLAMSIIDAVQDYLTACETDVRSGFRLVTASSKMAPAAASLMPAAANAGLSDAVRAAVDALANGWAQARGVPLVSCRSGPLFGPWQTASAPLAEALSDLAAARPARIEHGGETLRDWLPVADFAEGVTAALRRGRPMADYAFSGGAERRDMDIAEAFCAVLDARAPLPDGAAHVDLLAFTGDPLAAPVFAPLDSERTERALGWSPGGLHYGLQALAEWALTQAGRNGFAVRAAA